MWGPARRWERAARRHFRVTSHGRPQRRLSGASVLKDGVVLSPARVFLHFVFKTDVQGRDYLHVTDEKDLERLKAFSKLAGE